MQKNKIKAILKKKNKKPITCLSLYSKTVAEIADKYCDIILVGDSLGMALYGMDSTKKVDIDTMILHGKTVKKYTKKSLLVIDMPYRSYSNKSIAYRNAKKIIKKTGCDAVKLEGGAKIVNIIKHLVKKGVPVMGHVGLLPQYTKKFKIKGKNFDEQKKIIKDSIAVSNSGVFAIVVECVIEKLAKNITSIVSVPTIGIGASKNCDGQILVADDILGLSNFYPKFVKKYSNLRNVIDKSIKKYINDVKLRKFPSDKHVYK